ncbi:putative quinol monooxygenase [Streptomyces sp. NPDC004788]
MAVYVVARWLVKPGEEERVAELLREIATASRMEAGCLGYRPVRSMANPAEIVLFEEYVDDAALTAHRESAHFQMLVLGQVVPLLEERSVTICEAVA